MKFADFQQIPRARSIAGSIRRWDMLHKLILALANSVLPPEKLIRLVGVTVSNFEDGMMEGPTPPDFPASHLPGLALGGASPSSPS